MAVPEHNVIAFNALSGLDDIKKLIEDNLLYDWIVRVEYYKCNNQAVAK